MSNFVEELVGEFYKTKGYLVSTNYWIPFKTTRNRVQREKKQSYEAQSWTDIDVLAKNDKELLIIQVKATINQRKIAEKINLYFARVEQFLKDGIAPDGKTNIGWWTKGIKIRKIVVYEDKYSPPSYQKILTDNGVETIFFGIYLNDIINYIQSKKGQKEENSTMRLLHFFNSQKLIVQKKNLEDS